MERSHCSNKHQRIKMRPLFESPPRPLLKSAWSASSTMAPTRPQVGDLNRCIFFLTQDWNDVTSFKLDLNECQEAKMWALFESPPGPLFMSGLRPLARYCTSVNHYHILLNMFIKFVENNVSIYQGEI